MRHWFDWFIYIISNTSSFTTSALMMFSELFLTQYWHDWLLKKILVPLLNVKAVKLTKLPMAEKNYGYIYIPLSGLDSTPNVSKSKQLNFYKALPFQFNHITHSLHAWNFNYDYIPDFQCALDSTLGTSNVKRSEVWGWNYLFYVKVHNLFHWPRSIDHTLYICHWM